MRKKYLIRAFDIETLTHDNKMIPYCISYVYGNDARAFYGLSCVDDFVDYIFNELKRSKLDKKKIYIFSHNLTFDGSIIMQNIKSSDIKFGGLFVNGSIYNISMYRPNFGKIFFKCSYKFFPTSLQNANKLLKVDKKIDFNHRRITLNNLNIMKDETVKYCINDSKLVFQLISAYDSIFSKYLPYWISECNSIPSSSLNIFSKVFNKYCVELATSLNTDQIIRDAYFGGRCEVFGNPRNFERIYHYDFTGMYNQVMAEKFWYGGFIIEKNCKEVKEGGFYFIEYFSNQNIPILPERCRLSKKLCFKAGHGSGLHWFEEINLFTNNGGVIKNIKYGIIFSKNGYPFKEFVNHFAEKRKVGKNENTICKLITNSVYGRLGMSEIRDKTVLLNLKDYLKFRKKHEKKILKEVNVGELYIVQYMIPSKGSINSNVALAAMITSKARIKLYTGFNDVLQSGGRILYSDTDSIFAAYNKNVDNLKFGEVFWDVSKDDTLISEAIFAMPKAYAIRYANGEELTKLKGVGKNVISFSNFKTMFATKSKLSAKIEILKKNNYIIRPGDILKIVDLNKYDKRIFINSYTESIPRGGEMGYDSYLKLLNNRKDVKNPFSNPNYSMRIKVCKNLERSREIMGCWVECGDDYIKIFINDDKIVEATEIIFFIINNEAVQYDHLFKNSKTGILEYFLGKNAMILDVKLSAYGDDIGKSLESVDFIETIEERENE